MKERSKDLIRSSFKEMAPDFKDIILKFYERLFEINPQYRKMFKNDMEAQAEKFIHMLGLGVRGLDNEAELLPALQFLGKNHKTYGVKDSDYSIVKEALIYSFKEHLGDSFDKEKEQSWGEFYEYLATKMIDANKKS